MVETKTAKRKASAKTAVKAAHAISEASNKALKDKRGETAGTKAGSPGLASRTRSRATTGAAGGARTGKGEGEKRRDAAEAKGKKDQNDEAASVRAEGPDSDSEEEGEGGEQRLVIKLDKKQEKKLQDRLKKIDKPVNATTSGESSVVYLGRIPHGFFEKEMRAYFTQFGEVQRLRISRNKKTGKSKHYAFIEFVHPEVAVIVAETHDNMLICDRMVKCNLVPVEKIHETMWTGADQEFKAFPWKKMAKAVSGRKRTAEEETSRVKGLVRAEKKKTKQARGPRDRL